MKKRYFIVPSVALATALATGATLAGGGHIFERLDTDDNGVISSAESQTAATDRFTRKDTNGDGFIDINEMMARWSDMPVDTDGDGKISAAEHSAMAQNMFERVDSDGNGEISEDEAEQVRKRWHERRHDN